MKHYTLLFLLVSILSTFQVQGQRTSKTLVIGQFDKPDERYAIEVAITDLFTKNGVPSVPSLNVIKQGADPSILALDSIQSRLKQAGIDKIAIVNVRGYDRRFKISDKESFLLIDLAAHTFLWNPEKPPCKWLFPLFLSILNFSLSILKLPSLILLAYLPIIAPKNG